MFILNPSELCDIIFGGFTWTFRPRLRADVVSSSITIIAHINYICLPEFLWEINTCLVRMEGLCGVKGFCRKCGWLMWQNPRSHIWYGCCLTTPSVRQDRGQNKPPKKWSGRVGRGAWQTLIPCFEIKYLLMLSSDHFLGYYRCQTKSILISKHHT